MLTVMIEMQIFAVHDNNDYDVIIWLHSCSALLVYTYLVLVVVLNGSLIVGSLAKPLSSETSSPVRLARDDTENCALDGRTSNP